jgi:hypothetical protein
MRLTFVICFALFYGNALAQRGFPRHAGAAATGGSGSLSDFLRIAVIIIVGVIILSVVFALLKWLLSLPLLLWRKLREIINR